MADLMPSADDGDDAEVSTPIPSLPIKLEDANEPLLAPTDELDDSTESEPTRLPDVAETSGLVFSSSEARIVLPSQRPRDPRLHAALLFVVVASILGVINGADTIAGDSGMVRDRDFIYSQTQGPGSDSLQGTATLTGVLLLPDGTPATNHTIVVDTLVTGDDGLTHMEFPNTRVDDTGRFRIDGLNPGLNKLHVRNDSHGAEGMSHRILLSPPALFEPFGFTHLTLTYASPSDFDAAENESHVRWIDMSESERGKEPYDPTAAQVYDVFGVLFAGVAVFGLILGGFAWHGKSVLLMRTAAFLTFFSQGYFYSACCLSLLALLVTVGARTDE